MLIFQEFLIDLNCQELFNLVLTPRWFAFDFDDGMAVVLLLYLDCM